MTKQKTIKKLYPEKHNKNIVVEIFFSSTNKKTYRCAGVLIKETEKYIRIGFNAKDNNLIDYLDIDYKDIKKIEKKLKKDIIKI